MFSFFKKKKPPQQISAERIYGYILTQIDWLITINFLSFSIRAVIILHAAFYVLVQDFLIQFDANDYFLDALRQFLRKSQNSSDLSKLFYTYVAHYTKLYTRYDPDSMPFLFMTAEYDAFETKDSEDTYLDRWYDDYEAPFTDAANRVLDFTGQEFGLL